MDSVDFEPAISTNVRPHTLALDWEAIGVEGSNTAAMLVWDLGPHKHVK